jgi:hypothetical protein
MMVVKVHFEPLPRTAGSRGSLILSRGILPLDFGEKFCRYWQGNYACDDFRHKHFA